jgi:putative ATPase
MALPPLAERMRPTSLRDLVGQGHLTDNESVLQKALAAQRIPSMILWGPPGVGKTSIAGIIANTLNLPFHTLSAISSGVKDIREVIETAKNDTGSILFIDEIHRFNKSQQDALLGAVEKGIITLIGATTENPSFEVNSALLSRCQVFVLKALEKEHLIQLIDEAIQKDEIISAKNIHLKEKEALIRLAGGDARKTLNLLELVVDQAATGQEITDEWVMKIAQQRTALYDKSGEQHYDIISAFIKSMRGSDPNGAVYWLARMIEGGEAVTFIARRMVIFASEDIGNANPNALLMANTTFQAVDAIGYPESRIILSQCAIYLATSIKSNASYMAIEDALTDVRKLGDLPVPLHLRNAPTKMMKNMDYGKDYKYAHQFENNFILQDHLPEKLNGKTYYSPQRNPREEEIRKFLKERWKEKYGY